MPTQRDADRPNQRVAEHWLPHAVVRWMVRVWLRDGYDPGGLVKLPADAGYRASPAVNAAKTEVAAAE